MTNYEYIKGLSVEDMADYMYSILLCGKLLQTNKCVEIVDYVEWLNKVRDNEA